MVLLEAGLRADGLRRRLSGWCAALGHLLVVDIRERGSCLRAMSAARGERGAQQRQPYMRLEPLAVTQPAGPADDAVSAGVALCAGQLAPACAPAKAKWR
jgi:hypothetical protein